LKRTKKASENLSILTGHDPLAFLQRKSFYRKHLY
jgi:hypothetical protein